ncbi:lamin tail domain-containing protein [Colwellia sp. BRX10-3]|uniref:lamin tail domain-containing protein n=1 Tax=Colwellia sp. BRX10-3 TaxID=2759844 RepID=UPI0015F560FC|nr:lamin tail domain-containing protein [Colwellia sp. BRX10-3]MBA6389544.1 lamin tail domain-containing protein [Colwellia sp. BRX10-3]
MLSITPILSISSDAKQLVANKIELDSAKAISIALNQRIQTGQKFQIKNDTFDADFSNKGWKFNSLKDGPTWDWTLTKTNIVEPINLSAAPEAFNQRDIRYYRGPIIEQYIAKAQSIEQQFIIPAPLALNGKSLEIEGRINSSGTFIDTTNGWLWQNDKGVVSLGDVTVFDANGLELAATMEIGEHYSRIIVDGEALANASYPVLIDPEVGTNDFRVSTMGPDGSTGYTADNPAIAYNSSLNEYLVVWEGDDDTLPLVDQEIEIFGQRINAETGALVGSRIRISEMGPDGDTTYRANTPTIAYSSAEDEYLVCWSGDDDSAPKVNEELEIHCNYVVAATGTTPFFPFIYSDMGTDGSVNYSAFNPDVTYNAINNEYLLVWEGSDNTGTLVASEFEIYGQRILSTTGAEIGSNDFRISDMGNDGDADFDALRPAVTHNTTDNEYLVVWAGENQALSNEFEIYGQRIDGSSGTTLGTNELGDNDFRISDMGDDNSSAYSGFEPDVAYNTFNNEYLVVWEGEDNILPLVIGETEIFGQRLSGTTAVELGSNDFRISDMGTDTSTTIFALAPAATYNSANNEYLVVWNGDDDSATSVDDEFEIYGQRLIASSGLAIGTNDFRISNMGTDGDADFDALEQTVLYNPKNNEYLVVWSGENQTLVDEFEIYAQRITNDLSLVINEVDYDQPGTDNNEFIELKNIGDAGINLSNFTIELYDENLTTVYKTLTLPNTILAPGDYYVICSNASRVNNCDQDDAIDINLIQNGAPDAIALKLNSTIIDVISYEGNSSPPYIETSGSGIVDLSTMNSGGIGRFPDGSDTDNNSADWSFLCTTPGSANINVTSDCNVASVLTITGTALNYTEGDGAVQIDNLATASDFDSVDFDLGDLSIDITANGSTNDRLSIKNIGNAGGEIGFDTGTGNVSYEGTLIATSSGGNNGSTPLVISFNANATITAINALIKNITFENISNSPSTLNRTVSLILTDDDLDASNTVTKSITVANTNNTGSITIDDTTPNQGQLLTATVTDIDGVSGVITYQWLRGATVVSTAQTYTTVQADVGQTLTVNASYTDDQGSAETPVSSATNSVININDSPISISLSNNYIEESLPISTVIGLLSTADPDFNDSFTYTLVEETGNNDNAAFTINGQYLQSAEVLNFEIQSTYSIRIESEDFEGLKTAQNFTIEVININEAIEANNDTVSGNEDSVLLIDVFENDVAEVTLTQEHIQIISFPEHGQLEFNQVHQKLQYTPIENYFGADSFTYQLSVNELTSSTATVSINIINVNDPPQFDNMPITEIRLEEQYSFAIETSDIDNDELHLTLISGPAWLTLNNNILLGSPTDEDLGESLVTLQVDDSALINQQSFILKVLPKFAPDLTVAIKANSQISIVDEILDYQVTLKNIGSKQGDNITLALHFSGDLTITENQYCVETSSDVNLSLICTVESMPVGVEKIIKLSGISSKIGDIYLWAEAIVENDSDSSNNQASYEQSITKKINNETFQWIASELKVLDIVIGDIDNSQQDDVLMLAEKNQQSRIYLSQLDGLLIHGASFNLSHTPITALIHDRKLIILDELGIRIIQLDVLSNIQEIAFMPFENGFDLALSDFDKNGINELVVLGMNQSAIYSINTKNVLSLVASWPSTDYKNIAISNLNQDELPDLVITTTTGNNLVYLNNQTIIDQPLSDTITAFDSQFQLTLNQSLMSKARQQVTLADIDQDGDVDILFANKVESTSLSTIPANQVYYNDGEGQFNETNEFGQVSSNALYISSLTESAITEIVSVNNHGGHQIYQSTMGELQLTDSITTSSPGALLQLIDLNGDGYKDLLQTVPDFFGVRTQLNDGQGNFGNNKADLRLSLQGEQTFTSSTIVNNQAVIENLGPKTALELRLTITLPHSIRIASVNSRMGQCQVTNSLIYCSLERLTVGDKWTINIEIIPELNVKSVELKAFIVSSTLDLTTENNITSMDLTLKSTTKHSGGVNFVELWLLMLAWLISYCSLKLSTERKINIKHLS